MKNSKDIRQALFVLNSEPELVDAIDQAIESGSLLKSDRCPVLDKDGNPLEKDGKYMHGKVMIRVDDWEFRAGNLLGRFYRVFYTDSNLDKSFLVVDARYPDGVFGGATYPSELGKL